MDPNIDGRLAQRIRDVAKYQTDTELYTNHFMSAEEKARVLNIAADVLEEYIMAAQDGDIDA